MSCILLLAGWLNAGLQSKHDMRAIVSLRLNQVLQALPAFSPSKQHGDVMQEDDPIQLPEKPERQTVLCSTLHLSTGNTSMAMGMTVWMQLRSVTELPHELGTCIMLFLLVFNYLGHVLYQKALSSPSARCSRIVIAARTIRASCSQFPGKANLLAVPG